MKFEFRYDNGYTYLVLQAENSFENAFIRQLIDCTKSNIRMATYGCKGDYQYIGIGPKIEKADYTEILKRQNLLIEKLTEINEIPLNAEKVKQFCACMLEMLRICPKEE